MDTLTTIAHAITHDPLIKHHLPTLQLNITSTPKHHGPEITINTQLDPTGFFNFTKQIATLDLDDHLHIYTTNKRKPIATIEYADPNFIDQIITTLINIYLDARHNHDINHIQ